MAIQSAIAKLNIGVRLWVVDKNISAALVSSFSLGNKNLPLSNGLVVYPNVLPFRILRAVADLQAPITLTVVDERYKTYGGGNNVISPGSPRVIDNTDNWKVIPSLTCKFPTYFRIDVEKLQLPEGTDCTVDFEEGWILEGDFPGSTRQPSAAVNNFFTFRTPWYGLSFMTAPVSLFQSPNRIRPGVIAASSLFSPSVIAVATRANTIDLDSVSTMNILPNFTASALPNQMRAVFGPERVNPITSRIEPVLADAIRVRFQQVDVSSAFDLLTDFDIAILFEANVGVLSNIDIAAEKIKSFGNTVLPAVTAASIDPIKTASAISNMTSTAQQITTTRITASAGANMTLSASLTAGVNRIIPSLIAWGNNGQGQLGTGDTTQRLTPTFISADWDAISAGQVWSVAVKNGELYTWGNNASGHLGNGSQSESIFTADVTTPTRIGTDTNWLKISCGARHTLAIKTDGSLWSWGEGSSGQLGFAFVSGAGLDKLVPTRVGVANNWVNIAGGGAHSLAINSSGELYACGSNYAGQVGRGTQQTNSTPTFTRIASSINLSTTIAAGQASSYAITAAGQLLAWGQGLAFGANTDIYLPQLIDSTDSAGGYTAVDSGGNEGGGTNPFVLAVRNGELYSWGTNTYGQLGSSRTTSFGLRIGSLGDWHSVSAGNVSSHAMAIRGFSAGRGGQLYVWGQNTSGQLGLGNTTNINSPTLIDQNNFWLEAAGGQAHTITRGPGIL
jgi:alpha-tubulin suppressor-like RCC1 family protein